MSKKGGAGLIIVIIIAVIAVALLGGGMLYYTSGLGAVDSSDKEDVIVEIPSGSGASTIVGILNEQGLVKNATCAKINARVGGYDSLQANTYIFNKSMSFTEMMEAINTGNFDYLSKESIQIIAGWTIPEIASNLSGQLPYSEEEMIAAWSDETYLKELIDKYWFLTDDILNEDILYPLEGYFYADTYFLTEDNPSIETATAMFLDRMDTELTARKDSIESMGFSIHQFLTLTSIVTAEGGSIQNDLPTVAGVFMNRLEKGMAFGSDVTVNYANQVKKVNLKQSELNVDSKYNTRKNAGWPPSPICAVLDSRMDAVIDYDHTDCLFFYGCPDGTVIFSKTMEEHNKAARENPWPDDM